MSLEKVRFYRILPCAPINIHKSQYHHITTPDAKLLGRLAGDFHVSMSALGMKSVVMSGSMAIHPRYAIFQRQS